MAKATAPIRSPRRLYVIPNLVRRKTGTGENATSEVGDGYVLMKESVAELFGDSLTELDHNDAAWFYERTISGQTVQFRKNLGGYKYKQIHLHSLAGIDVSEKIVDPETGEVTEETNTFKKITIGLPSGSSMGRFQTFLEGTDVLDSIDKIVTHDGKPIFVKTASAPTTP